jgi:hypothetical protein
MNRLVAIFLCVLPIAACAASPPEFECKGKHVDLGWVRVSERDPREDVAWLLTAPRTPTEAMRELGPVLKSERNQISWLHTMRREGRDCEPSGRYKSTFLVHYLILEIEFDREAMTTCRVTERTIISSEPDPPISSRAVSSETKQCAAFLGGKPIDSKRNPR